MNGDRNWLAASLAALLLFWIVCINRHTSSMSAQNVMPMATATPAPIYSPSPVVTEAAPAMVESPEATMTPMPVVPSPEPSTEATEPAVVEFETDSAALSQHDRQVLDGLAQQLRSIPGAVVDISGHTDNRGNPVYNLNLSKRRADAARNYLIEQGVPAAQLRNATGYGEEQPAADNETNDGRQRNRRAVLRVHSE